MKKIDLDKVLAEKSLKWSKRVPKFAMNYLKRIVHQDELNYIIENFGDSEPLEFVRKSIDYVGITYSAKGLDKIDPNGRYVFASNHPFGIPDGVILVELIATHLGSVKAIANDLLLYVEPMRPLCIPVNKHGDQNRQAIRIFNDTFASDVAILTFPAGLNSRYIKGKVQDLPWRSNFVKKAVANRRDVIPVYFDGELSRWWYNLARIRKFLRIKINIEMLYLVNEMMKLRGSHFNVIFGEPISYKELQEMKDYSVMSEYVRKKSYELKK